MVLGKLIPMSGVSSRVLERQGQWIPLRASCIRTHNHRLGNFQILPNPSQRTRLSIQVIDWHIEESLNLAGMQVHCNYVVATGGLKHIRHKFCRYGSSRFVLLVLASIGEIRDYSSDTARGSCLAGIDDDQEFHESVVDIAWGGGLQYEDFKQLMHSLD